MFSNKEVLAKLNELLLSLKSAFACSCAFALVFTLALELLFEFVLELLRFDLVTALLSRNAKERLLISLSLSLAIFRSKEYLRLAFSCLRTCL